MDKNGVMVFVRSYLLHLKNSIGYSKLDQSIVYFISIMLLLQIVLALPQPPKQLLRLHFQGLWNKMTVVYSPPEVKCYQFVTR